jgi:hypothetical protein
VIKRKNESPRLSAPRTHMPPSGKPRQTKHQPQPVPNLPSPSPLPTCKAGGTFGSGTSRPASGRAQPGKAAPPGRPQAVSAQAAQPAAGRPTPGPVAPLPLPSNRLQGLNRPLSGLLRVAGEQVLLGQERSGFGALGAHFEEGAFGPEPSVPEIAAGELFLLESLSQVIKRSNLAYLFQHGIGDQRFLAVQSASGISGRSGRAPQCCGAPALILVPPSIFARYTLSRITAPAAICGRVPRPSERSCGLLRALTGGLERPSIRAFCNTGEDVEN